jgi:hypothetical protein
MQYVPFLVFALVVFLGDLVTLTRAATRWAANEN